MLPAFKTIIVKDLREIFASKSTWLPMFVLPVVSSALLPLIMLSTARHNFTGLATMDMILKNAPNDPRLISDSQKLLFIGLNKIVPMIFLIIPILTTCNIGSVSVVGEKQKNTLESLLYTPIDIRQLYLAKLTGTFGVAFLVTLACFLCFAATASLGTISQYGFSFLALPKWLTLIFWLCPILILLALSVIVYISARATSIQSAMQLSTLLVLPVFFLLLSQIAGTLSLGPTRIFVLGAALLAAGGIMFMRVLRGLTVEDLI